MPGSGEVRIRRSRREDSEALAALNNAVWNDDNSPQLRIWTAEEFERFHPEGGELVAELDGRLCGFVGMRPPTRMDSNRHVRELAIAVHPDAQGRGVGRLLLDAACRRAAEEGVRKLSLRVMSTNPGAISFYERCGFQVQGRLVEEFYINGRYVDDILMYKTIVETER